MKTLTELIADARTSHDIRNVLGLRENDRLILCPLPHHTHSRNTPSFSIFTRRNMQWWRCHGSCNLEGDVVDLIGFLRVAGYDKRDPSKIRAAVEMLDDHYQIVVPTLEPVVTLRGSEHRSFLPPGEEAITYAKTRGLALATLEKFRVGQSGHYLTMPCFEEGVLKGIKLRNLHPCAANKRFFQLEGSRLGLFNYDAVNLKRTVVFIVKGEIPCMLMDQIGFHQTCAPTGGEGSGRYAVQQWNTALALCAKIVIGDNDPPGIELGKKRSLLFGAELRFPPGKYKDVDQWLLADEGGAVKQLGLWAEEALKNW